MNAHVQPGALQVATPAPAPASNLGRRRKQLFLAFAGAVALAAAGAATYNIVVGSAHVETDNAYVDADTAQVTSLTAGPVAEVRVVDTQAVKRGDVLVVLDDTDRRLDLEGAEAALGDIVRRVRGYQANNTALSGTVAARQADLIRASADLARAQSEYDRRAPLAGSGVVSGEEVTSVKTQLDSARAAFAQAETNIQAAQGARESNNVLIEGVSLDQNPEVIAAQWFECQEGAIASSWNPDFRLLRDLRTPGAKATVASGGHVQLEPRPPYQAFHMRSSTGDGGGMARCRRFLTPALALGLAACATSGNEVRIVSQAHGSDFFSLGAPGVYKASKGLHVGGRVCRMGRSTVFSPRTIRIEHLDNGGRLLDTTYAASPAINRTFDEACRSYSTRVTWTLGEGDTLRACFDHGRACPVAAESKATVAAPAQP